MSIILKNLYKTFGRQIIVNNVTLEIYDGELFVLLGSSGSGKSTILRMIAGLTEEDSGKIEIQGRDVTGISPQKRKTGFVFQNYSVFQQMTVSKNVEFGLKVRKIPAAERKKKSAELLELIGLTGLESRYSYQLSGGQQQRVALARALAYNPDVLLLDEPFGALDVKIRTQLRRSLKLIQSQLNVTTILVTHDQEEAYELADRIGIINQGQIIEVNTPENLYNYPKLVFTATFVGSGNVLTGRKEKDNIRLGSVRIPFPPESPIHDENAPVRIMFRPEMTLLSKEEFKNNDVVKLSKGILKEIKFSGTHYKVIMEVKDLKGSQSFKRAMWYGQNAVTIEIQVTAADMRTNDYKINSEYWIGLRAFHVLEPSGLKILVYFDKSMDESPAAAFGLLLTKGSGGTMNLLSIVKHHDQLSVLKSRLEKLKISWQNLLVDANIKVRQGKYTEEVTKEAQIGHYEIILFDLKEDLKHYVTKKMQILLSMNFPVLIVKNPHPKINRILICTAIGEPGKSDISVGGRVAKTTSASVILLHILHTSTSEEEIKRVNYHLMLAKLSLNTLDVQAEIKLAQDNDIVGRILNETKSNDYDLLVIGASLTDTFGFYYLPQKTNQLIERANLPVLIVPMEKG